MDSHTEHEKYMQRCLELASLGFGKTAPNPMVGCVIVHNGKIIGEGYHKLFGGDHAEVEAIKSVKDLSLLKESTLYVNLEPCSHVGKTPPCTQLIMDKKIPRIVVGVKDPNPRVEGNGIKILRDHGCEVIKDILEKECIDLNERFFSYHMLNRPYIILKWAQTKDGFIDIKRDGTEKGIQWITDETCRRLVHKWRTEEQAVMVGSVTVKTDNPQLTAREWPGKNPIRITMDRKGIIPLESNIFDGSVQTLVFTQAEAYNAKHAEIVNMPPGQEPLFVIIKHLYQLEVQSLIIEGGAVLLDHFIQKRLWDEARVFIGDKEFGDGLKAPVINKPVDEIMEIGNSELRVYYNTL